VASQSSYDDIQDYIKQGLNVRSIAARIGMNELAARRIIYALSPGYRGTVNDDTPYGMDTESLAQRIKLGSLLYDLRESLKGDRVQVARLTGLNRNEQIAAEQRPFEHDWSISQIQRLAKAISVNYKDII
jgi:hypothetical protein